MAKAAPKPRAKPSKPRVAHSHSAKDLIIAFLMHGLGEWEAIRVQDGASRTSWRHAFEGLQAKDKATPECVSWFALHFASGARGRKGAKPGEARSYKAQQIKVGGPFLRLPLDVFGAEKGQPFIVHFQGDEIRVAPAHVA